LQGLPLGEGHGVAELVPTPVAHALNRAPLHPSRSPCLRNRYGQTPQVPRQLEGYCAVQFQMRLWRSRHRAITQHPLLLAGLDAGRRSEGWARTRGSPRCPSSRSTLRSAPYSPGTPEGRGAAMASPTGCWPPCCWALCSTGATTGYPHSPPWPACWPCPPGPSALHRLPVRGDGSTQQRILPVPPASIDLTHISAAEAKGAHAQARSLSCGDSGPIWGC
jgi:hypothetical protein